VKHVEESKNEGVAAARAEAASSVDCHGNGDGPITEEGANESKTPPLSFRSAPQRKKLGRRIGMRGAGILPLPRMVLPAMPGCTKPGKSQDHDTTAAAAQTTPSSSDPTAWAAAAGGGWKRVPRAAAGFDGGRGSRQGLIAGVQIQMESCRTPPGPSEHALGLAEDQSSGLLAFTTQDQAGWDLPNSAANRPDNPGGPLSAALFVSPRDNGQRLSSSGRAPDIQPNDCADGSVLPRREASPEWEGWRTCMESAVTLISTPPGRIGVGGALPVAGSDRRGLTRNLAVSTLEQQGRLRGRCGREEDGIQPAGGSGAL
jgi:hypothetical protein